MQEDFHRRSELAAPASRVLLVYASRSRKAVYVLDGSRASKALNFVYLSAASAAKPEMRRSLLFIYLRNSHTQRPRIFRSFAVG